MGNWRICCHNLICLTSQPHKMTLWILYEPSSMYLHRQRDQWWNWQRLIVLLHTLQFSHLDLASDRRPNRNPKPGGHLECSSCLCTFLFYDKLRSVALARLDEDPKQAGWDCRCATHYIPLWASLLSLHGTCHASCPARHTIWSWL